MDGKRNLDPVLQVSVTNQLHSGHIPLILFTSIFQTCTGAQESDERASLGDPDDLEELASSSTTTPGSSEVSLASGSTGLAGSKLERVIQQL